MNGTGKARGIVEHFPDFFAPQDTESTLLRFIAIFAAELDQVEADLLRVMQAHYVDTANNADSQGFGSTKKGDLDRILTMYLENLGGTSQFRQLHRGTGDAGVRDDDIYRQRMKGLINVLRGSVTTREAIIAVVAANLGITGDDAAAQRARTLIRIEEFLPESIKLARRSLALFEEFYIDNPNAVETVPEFVFHVQPHLELSLSYPRLVDVKTGRAVRYAGTLVPGDVLALARNGIAYRNGEVVALEGATPALPPGESHWRFEASVGLARAYFDRSALDYSTFEQDRLNPLGIFDVEQGRFDEAVFPPLTPVVDLDTTLLKLTPGVFTVRIPWDIPGFTDKFDASQDDPRDQVKYVVDKVKATGVFSEIAYEKRFIVAQGMIEAFHGEVDWQGPVEEHIAEEMNFDIGGMQMPYPGGIEHEMADALVLSGVFDMTSFDSLNTFA